MEQHKDYGSKSPADDYLTEFSAANSLLINAKSRQKESTDPKVTTSVKTIGSSA